MKSSSAPTFVSLVCVFSLFLVPHLRSNDLESAPYKQASTPLEQRVQDLLGRMTVEEKARQLDLYSGADGDKSTPIAILDHIPNNVSMLSLLMKAWHSCQSITAQGASTRKT